MADRFYMACLRETVGTNMSFHCRDGQGYSSDIRKAHVYTREEAQRDWEGGRTIDLPVSADAVDQLVVLHVDHQLIPGINTLAPDCDRYVGFAEGRWNGNDVYWLSDGQSPTADFTRATVYQAARPETDGVIWLPYSLAAAAQRPTFNIHQLNHRTMIQGAGLRVPDWIKRYRRRCRSGTTGKVRWNCPGCGRISWQHNPYEFDGCRSAACCY